MWPNLERRAFPIALRQQVLVGHCIVFNVRSVDLGGFVEIVRPGAVARALAPDANIVALFDHQSGAVLGRTPKTLRLSTDATGLAFELTPPATQVGQDVLALVERGDLAGGSFGFRTVTDAWSHDGDQVVRELLDIEIAEISLTAFPTYRETDVAFAQRALRLFQHHTHQGRRLDVLQRHLRVSQETRR